MSGTIHYAFLDNAIEIFKGVKKIGYNNGNESEKNMRGILTTEIQNKANSFLKREISQKELRLYPYIDYSIKNGCQGWSYSKMDEEEIKILNRLYDEGYIIYSPEKIIVTRNFYNFMQDVLAISYVEEFL